MLENQDIFKRYLEVDEDILWSLKPYAKKYPVIDDLLIVVLLQLILLICAIFFHYLTLTLKNDITQTLGIILYAINTGILGKNVLNFNVGGGDERESLRNSEYFMTNKKIFSIRKNTIGFLFLK